MRAAWLCVWLVLAACAPLQAPPGLQSTAPMLEAGTFVAHDGTRLPLREWAAEGVDRPRAVILALHGMSDYSNAFDMPGKTWARDGITTLAYDQRGFGAGPDPGIWAGADAMRADLNDFVAAARARYPGVPVFALGESMGGAVLLTALASATPPAVDGAVLVAPAVWSRGDMPVTYRVALFLAAHVTPSLVLSNSAASHVVTIMPSDNIPMMRALGRDPLFQKQTRADTLFGLVNLMDEAREAPAHLGAAPPMVFLYGAHDQVIPAPPTRAVIAALGEKGSVHRYDQGYHMLLRDLDRALVQKDTADWILDQATKSPPGRYLPGTIRETIMEKQNNDLRKGKPGADANTDAVLAGHTDQAMPTSPKDEHIVNPGVGDTAGMAEGQVTKSN